MSRNLCHNKGRCYCPDTESHRRSCGDTLVVLWQTETYVAHFLEVAIVISLVGDVSLFQLCQKCLC